MSDVPRCFSRIIFFYSEQGENVKKNLYNRRIKAQQKQRMIQGSLLDIHGATK